MRFDSFHAAVAACLLAAAVSCGSRDLPSAITPDDAWKAYDAFNSTYLDPVKHIYKNTDRDSAAVDRWNGAAAIWCQPMYVDMAMNASELAARAGDARRAARYRDLAARLLRGNIDHYAGFDFDDGNTNTGWFIYDDIQWWTITLARAAKFFGDDSYRALAARSFARVWYGSPRIGDTGSYADPSKGLGGGMFWQWQPLENPEANQSGDGKMSCINFPTVIAAMLLHDLTPETQEADDDPDRWSNRHGDFVRPHFETKARYLEIAREIYDWSVENLTDPASGMVHDHRHGDRPGGHPLLYNQGTFIGASVLLYEATSDRRYLNHAVKGADYSVERLATADGYLPWAHSEEEPYAQGSLEQGIYPAIWAQYMKRLVEACGEEKYLPFIEKNMADGWKHRNAETSVCDGEAGRQTAADNVIGSYAASSTPALMLLFTPAEAKKRD